MFDFEEAIRQWRRRMSRAGINRGVIVELEEHLREAVHRQTRLGRSIEQAFEIATHELGEPKTLSHEFSKTEGVCSAGWPKAITLALIAMLLIIATLVAGSRVASSPLLFLHVFSLTSGYCTLLLAGCLGIPLVASHALKHPSISYKAAVGRSLILCYQAALLLLVAGLITGSLWLKSKLGIIWGDNQEAATLLALGWVTGTLVVPQYFKSRELLTAWLCIAGAIITSGGWFLNGVWTLIACPVVAFLCLVLIASRIFKIKRHSLLSSTSNNFTHLALRATKLAHEEAANLGHDYVGTEHLLLGIISSESGVLIDVLHKWGMDGASIRNEVERTVPAGRNRKSSRDIPYTPRAQNALSFAAQQARELKHAFLAPEHIFLGLLLEQEGVAGLVLRKFGIDVDQARKEILDRMGPDGEDGALPALA